MNTPYDMPPALPKGWVWKWNDGGRPFDSLTPRHQRSAYGPDGARLFFKPPRLQPGFTTIILVWSRPDGDTSWTDTTEAKDPSKAILRAIRIYQVAQVAMALDDSDQQANTAAEGRTITQERHA